MQAIRELGVALRATGQLLMQARYWSALLGALVSLPILLTFTLLGGIVMAQRYGPLAMPAGGAVGYGPLILSIAVTLLVAPLLLRAWCPVAARAAAAAMRLPLPELALAPFSTFLARWLGLCVVVGVLTVASWFMPGMLEWFLLVPVAVALSGMHVRCALCLHASQAEADAIAASTLWRRTLLWTAVCALPSLLLNAGADRLMLQGGLAGFGANADGALGVLKALALMLGMAIVLPVWASLSLQPLQAVAARRRTGRAVPEGASAAGWLVVSAACALALGAIVAFKQPPSLIHYHLTTTDSDYAARYGEAGRDALVTALMDYACKRDAARVDYLLRKKVKPPNGKFDKALLCAVENGDVAAVKYVLLKGADINAAPADLTALQRATERSDDPMVAFLLAHNAQPSQRGKDGSEKGSMTPLQIAVQHRDFAIVRMLVDANATADEAGPETPIYYLVQATLKASAGQPIAWEPLLAEALAAGLPVNAVDVHGNSLLHWAASEGRLDLIAVLRKLQLDPRKENGNGVLPIMQLVAWYDVASDTEPGPELEVAMAALIQGFVDVNGTRNVEIRNHGVLQTLNAWSIGGVAERRPRVAAMFRAPLRH
ncbi:MAG: hypothetical protein V4631_09845 [Pseudomonadota bacterium]